MIDKKINFLLTKLPTNLLVQIQSLTCGKRPSEEVEGPIKRNFVYVQYQQS